MDPATQTLLIQTLAFIITYIAGHKQVLTTLLGQFFPTLAKAVQTTPVFAPTPAPGVSPPSQLMEIFQQVEQEVLADARNQLADRLRQFAKPDAPAAAQPQVQPAPVTPPTPAAH